MKSLAILGNQNTVKVFTEALDNCINGTVLGEIMKHSSKCRYELRALAEQLDKELPAETRERWYTVARDLRKIELGADECPI